MSDVTSLIQKLKYPALLLIPGVVFVFVAFFRVVDLKAFNIEPHPAPIYALFGVGCVLVAAALAGMIFSTHPDLLPLGHAGVRLVEAGDRLQATVGKTTLEVRFGRVEDVTTANPSSLLVLPANEFFDDDCVRDTRTSLGAFVQSQLQGQVDKFEALIHSALPAPKGQVESQAGVMKTTYGLGTAVFLDNPLGRGHRLLLISIASQRAGQGLRAHVRTLFQAVEEIHTVMCDKVMDEVTMPLLGAGHGALRPQLALVCLLIGWAEFLFRPDAHHMTVRLVVFRASPSQSPAVPMKLARRLLRFTVSSFSAA